MNDVFDVMMVFGWYVFSIYYTLVDILLTKQWPLKTNWDEWRIILSCLFWPVIILWDNFYGWWQIISGKKSFL
jgi:hypothetical protein